MVWAAIALTVVASTGNNVGKALQKEATRKLPRFSLEPAILVQYARSRVWLAGLAADVAGALLMIGAFSLAPASAECVGFVCSACSDVCICSRHALPLRPRNAAPPLHQERKMVVTRTCRCRLYSQCQAWAWYHWLCSRTST